jgi:hypothetical protein
MTSNNIFHSGNLAMNNEHIKLLKLGSERGKRYHNIQLPSCFIPCLLFCSFSSESRRKYFQALPIVVWKFSSICSRKKAGTYPVVWAGPGLLAAHFTPFFVGLVHTLGRSIAPATEGCLSSVGGDGECWVMLYTILCRSLTLCFWPDSEPTKLLHHTK